MTKMLCAPRFTIRTLLAVTLLVAGVMATVVQWPKERKLPKIDVQGAFRPHSTERTLVSIARYTGQRAIESVVFFDDEPFGSLDIVKTQGHDEQGYSRGDTLYRDPAAHRTENTPEQRAAFWRLDAQYKKFLHEYDVLTRQSVSPTWYKLLNKKTGKGNGWQLTLEEIEVSENTYEDILEAGKSGIK